MITTKKKKPTTNDTYTKPSTLYRIFSQVSRFSCKNKQKTKILIRDTRRRRLNSQGKKSQPASTVISSLTTTKKQTKSASICFREEKITDNDTFSRDIETRWFFQIEYKSQAKLIQEKQKQRKLNSKIKK